MVEAPPFLTAAWRDLVMLNYEADPALLTPRVPAGTELDTWHGHALLSVVGFRFLDLRVLGLAIPGHRDFDEVNLRFYVRRPVGRGVWRRGVVFLREIVPRRLVAVVARLVYGEPYVRRPMRREPDGAVTTGGRPVGIRYAWRQGGRWHVVGGRTHGTPSRFAPGSEAEFITEHYWGYGAHPHRGTVEYRVEHPPWRVWHLEDATLDADVAAVWGAAFADALGRPPRSAFLAEGSAVKVYRPQHIARDDPAGAAA